MIPSGRAEFVLHQTGIASWYANPVLRKELKVTDHGKGEESMMSGAELAKIEPGIAIIAYIVCKDRILVIHKPQDQTDPNLCRKSRRPRAGPALLRKLFCLFAIWV